MTSFSVFSAYLFLVQDKDLKKTLPVQLRALHTIDSNWATGWSYNIGTNYTMEILGSFGGQTSVLHLNDSSGTQWITATHSFGENITAGKITVMVRIATGTPEFGINLYSEGGWREGLRMRQDNFEVSYGSTFNALDMPTTYVLNEWYQVGFEFNCTGNTTKTYINGVEKSSDICETETATFIDAFQLRTEASANPGAQGDYYIAWIDYSWVTSGGGGPPLPPIPGFEAVYLILGLFMIMGLWALIRRRKNDQSSFIQ